MLILLSLSCTGKRDPLREVRPENLPEHSDPAWRTLAFLEAGEHPLWFELGSQGPVSIEYPAKASLIPFAPWPHARYVTGFLIWEGCLVMAVNRDGFLVLQKLGFSGAEKPRSTLYRASAGGLWDHYTAESLFLWGNRPAALLYRNDFFMDPVAQSPFPQVFVLDKSSPVPLGALIPAFEDFHPPWEVEILRQGPDSSWYYRVKEKGKEQNETQYYRTGDLGKQGERVSPGQWRNSFLPEKPENTPLPLAALLDQAREALGEDKLLLLETLSPHFESLRLFSSGLLPGAEIPPESENSCLLYGYWREGPDPLALIISSEGMLFCSKEARRPTSLTALPEGFVYTGIALVENIITASWEEQQEAGIGAAGFMVMEVFW